MAHQNMNRYIRAEGILDFDDLLLKFWLERSTIKISLHALNCNDRNHRTVGLQLPKRSLTKRFKKWPISLMKPLKTLFGHFNDIQSWTNLLWRWPCRGPPASRTHVGRLSIKMSSYHYMDSHVKDKAVSLTWKSPYPDRKSLYWNRVLVISAQHNDATNFFLTLWDYFIEKCIVHCTLSL